MKSLLQILTIAALTIAFTFTAVATDYEESPTLYTGYVITVKGDTIKGQIQMLSPALNEIKVKLITSSGERQTFKAKEVKKYAFQVPAYNKETKQRDIEWVTYVRKNVEQAPIPFGPKDVLLERTVAGKINVYNHYVESRAAQHAHNHFFYVETANNMIILNRDNFKSILKEMVADYPELEAKVGKKGYGYRYISKIVKEYNDYNMVKSVEF